MPPSLNDQYASALARILRDPDPAAALQAVCAAPETSPALAALLGTLAPDGLRITALLVLQLRFNRLLSGSPAANAAFSADPAAFSRAFQRYHQEVEPHAENPVQEALAWAAWQAGR